MNSEGKQWLMLERLRGALPNVGQYFVPQPLSDTIGQLLTGRRADVVCDPWAGIGSVASVAMNVTQASRVYCFTANASEAQVGKELLKEADWKIGDSIALLKGLDEAIDVAASVLPFGQRSEGTISLRGDQGGIELRGALDGQLVALATRKLRPNGIGVFVVSPSLFVSPKSPLPLFASIGISIEAALALPAGLFAPLTNMVAYLIVVRNYVVPQMFVGQLSSDAITNAQVISNLNNQVEGGNLDLGRFVDPLTFRGLDQIRFRERYALAVSQFGAPAVSLEQLATAINLGRIAESFRFSASDNAIYVPLIGNSEVILSADELRLKPHNYAQVIIDPERSHAAFVAHFLNSELGKELREAGKTGVAIRRLCKESIGRLDVLVPALDEQREMLTVEAQIAAQQNTLLGLQNELADYRRSLWANPGSVEIVSNLLRSFSSRQSGNLDQQVSSNLSDWIETLPFPLASILRAWQATPGRDYKAKYEHLLHFFEASAEFISVVLLSAFTSNPVIFEPHKVKLWETLTGQNLSYRRATFGVWKITAEYLGKQTRILITDDSKKPGPAKADLELCAEMFADSSHVLPRSLSQTDLIAVISKANTMRNDWQGHGGVVGPDVARLRNESLLTQLQLFRVASGDMWSQIQFIRGQGCRPRRGVFENDIAVMMGSNGQFLTETRPMSIALDVEQLYLAGKNETKALRLLPFVRVGPSPQSAMNACYFFNRLEKNGARFVSYHFENEPELMAESSEVEGFIDSFGAGG